jgi:hypothetical protein
MVAGTLIAGSLLSAACMLRLWRTRGVHWWRKLAWSAVLALPFLGPLVYALLFEMPPAQPDEMRARENPDAVREWDRL